MRNSAAPRAVTALASIVYQSRAVRPWSEAELLRLLATAREKNASIDVTGVLVYDRERFFQWIEGPQSALTAVMNRVRSDARHADLEILSHQPIPSRLFPGWNMNLARRTGQMDVAADGLFVAAPGVLDELHVNRMRVQMVLAAMSIAAWEATSSPDAKTGSGPVE